MEFNVDLTGGEENTERHRGFALLAHAVDYELTGSAHELGVINAGIAKMRSPSDLATERQRAQRLLQLPAGG